MRSPEDNSWFFTLAADINKHLPDSYYVEANPHFDICSGAAVYKLHFLMKREDVRIKGKPVVMNIPFSETLSFMLVDPSAENNCVKLADRFIAHEISTGCNCEKPCGECAEDD